MFKYFGGKSYLKRQLYAHFPHANTFVDVFGGSGKVLMGVSLGVYKTEVLNDIDPEIYAVYRAVKDDVEPLITELSRYSWNEDTHRKIQRMDSCAARTILLHQWSRADIRRAPFSKEQAGGHFSGDKRPGRTGGLNPAAFRLRDAILSNDTWQNVIDLWDTPDTFFYLDPPYVGSSRFTSKVYAFEFTTQNHIDLCKRINSVKGKVVLSGYDNPLYRE